MNVYFNTLYKSIRQNKYFWVLSLIYFLFRTFNLTSFPLFNDESIYLDWGYREVNTPGNLYYSLYDAKQPMLMWIFGLMQNILSDPVFAGRLVSVFTGFITLVGIYKLTIYILDKRTALLAIGFYILIPLFSFYDRQALMESAVSAVGVWGCYFLVKSIIDSKLIQFCALGVILGIGYFVKTSPIIFMVTSLLLILIFGIVNKSKEKTFNGIIILIVSFFCSIFLLIINPQFWASFSSNSRFSLTISEILRFPFAIWSNSLLMNLKIGFFLITPVIFLTGIAGVIYLLKTKNIKAKITVLFFVIAIVLETLTSRGSIDRYVAPFFPLLVIFSAFFIFTLINNKHIKIAIFVLFFAVITSFPLTLLQLFNQVDYFRFYGKISGIDYYHYLNTYTTGYGLKETFSYLDKFSENEKVFIGVALNTGNPESAVIVNYNKNANVKVVYMDARLFPPQTPNFKCIYLGRPTFFVSREEQLSGLDKFWKKIKTIKNPYGDNTIGIYLLRNDCTNALEILNLSGS